MMQIALRPSRALPLLAALAFAAAAGPASAQSPAAAQASTGAFDARTTADLAALCGTAPAAANYVSAIAFCHGFLQGAGQYHGVITQPGSGHKPVYCVPVPPPTRADAATAFVTWVAANPGRAQELAVDGLARWAQSTYPCPVPPRRGTR